MHKLELGIYQHYKGEYYLTLGVGQHTETAERLVVYVPLYVREGPRIRVRPYDMFFDEVAMDGKTVPRFTFIGAEMPAASG